MKSLLQGHLDLQRDLLPEWGVRLMNPRCIETVQDGHR